MIYDACMFLPNEWPQDGSIFDHSRFKCQFQESNHWSGSGQIAIFETAGPHVHLEYIIACSSMFFHSSSNELRTKLLVWFWIGIMGCSLSRFKVQALTHWHMGTAATLLLEWNTFEAKVLRKHLRLKCFHSSNRVAAVRLPISKQQVHVLRVYQACTHYIVLQHGLF